MLDIIVNNPYRILGVFSNSSKKEMITNQSKISAFTKVGKQVSFPIDLSSILGAPNRTDETISKPNSLLTLQVDQLKYAQFWFIKVSPLDEIAFNKLTNGDMAAAIEIWNKNNSFSSLQNKAVCAMIQSNYLEAVTLAEQLYSHYTESFLSCLVDNASLFSQETLIKSFIDVLVDNQGTPQENNYIDLKSIAASLDNPIWKEYIKSRLLIPLTDKVEHAISDAKKECSKKPSQGIEIAQKLKTVVAENLPSIEEFLSKEDLQYKQLADKAGLAILQCSINAIDRYFKTYDYNNFKREAKTALSLFRYAQSIVVGDDAQSKCAKNIQILQEVVDKLPTDDKETATQYIEEAISRHCKQPAGIRDVIDLVYTCKPFLDIIAEQTGTNSSYYINLSTRVVDKALNNIVEEVNSALKLKLDSEYSDTQVKQILLKAWYALLYTESLKMADYYKSKWISAKLTLKGLCVDYKVDLNKPINEPKSETKLSKLFNRLGNLIHKAYVKTKNGFAV